MAVKTLIYCQADGLGLHPVTVEIAVKAGELSAEVIGVLICGEVTERLSEELKGLGLTKCYVFQGQGAIDFQLETYREKVLEVIAAEAPEVFLVGATLEGRSLAPSVAAFCETGVTADCTALEIDESGLLVQIRPAFGEAVMAQILTPTAKPQIATVRPGVFGGTLTDVSKNTKLIVSDVEEREVQGRQEIITRETRRSSTSSVVIAVGGGLQKAEDIGIFKGLCERYGAELMSSRKLVERGWLPQSKQIGLSGQAVAPELLITFGISGSVQFRSGINGVGKLIAVCDDPAADILAVADVPIVGDLYTITEQLVAK